MKTAILVAVVLIAALITVSLLTVPGTAAPVGKTNMSPAGLEKATFAGGCFWCMEHPFDELPGVVSVRSGYTGGTKDRPTYEEVSSGTTGHAESVQILFDPRKIGYAKLLEVYWHNVDPTVENQQFCDHGHQYRSAIFFESEKQHALAEASKKAVQQQLGKTVYTEVVPALTFWPAEEYHQHYYKKNPIRYKFYRSGCGRDARLHEIWGDQAGH
ncbi:MAG: peptide-methionine (S)-S-oxide reductase MsrA [Acidobacteriota bacterium]